MKNEVSSYLENISLVILGIFFLAFPLVFTDITTDIFTLPKQLLLAGTVLISILILGAKMISDRALRFYRTPFDLPIFIFIIVLFLSSIFSVNRYDSLIMFIPLFLSVLLYYIITNLVRTESSVFFLTSAFILGTLLSSILSSLSLFKIYVLPFKYTYFPSFNSFGSLLDQAIYIGLALIISISLAFYCRQKNEEVDKNEAIQRVIIFTTTSILLIIGLSITIYKFLILQKILLLPLTTGVQTAFAAISQDSQRLFQSFFLGSGFGTYGTVFARFKQPAFNLDSTLWNLGFLKSSSFVLELLATAGVLGVGAFVYLIIKIIKESDGKKTIKQNFIFLAVIVAIILSFLLPFTFPVQTAFFMILGLFAANQGLNSKNPKFYEIELQFVAFKKGIIPFLSLPVASTPIPSRASTKILPVTFFILCLILVGFMSILIGQYTIADALFQKSFIAASSNNGLQTYNNQVSAIKIFPYKDSYFRTYSQTNLALANSLLATQPKNSSISAETQQTIYTLIQQSINSARTAVNISPSTATNWENLSSIYRSLIGFGQNAENFAIISEQQAIALSPNDPQGYLSLGGIYYQLGQWENAQRQFQIAVNLKPDYSNGYYNLGHALESKGDLEGALKQYETVKTLVATDKEGSKKITAEIEELKKKIGSAAQTGISQQQSGQTGISASQNQQPLNISEPQTKLPEQQTPVEIPGPASQRGEPKGKSSPTPTPSSKTPSVTPSL
ncbi:MAG: tetratricopeptide repeat protein [Patescibacteria group bacterium]|nr:tetratricopeptide repeat protein [Patescibacteria group bacterium]